MGSFYTNAICSFIDSEIIERYIKDNKRNAFILVKEDDEEFIVITEQLCDTQSLRENNIFFRPLSVLTKNPLLSCIVHDSDDLLLCLFSKGKDANELISSLEYCEGEEIIAKNIEALVETYGGDASKISKMHTTEHASKHAFAEDFQKEIYSNRRSSLGDWCWL